MARPVLPGPKGDTGSQGIQGVQGIQGPVGPLPTVLVASLTSCCVSIANTAVGEANAIQVLIKGTPSSGKYLARVDAQLNNFGALWFDYHCKLQSLTYPAFLGTPFTDIPGTRRDVSWRTGKDDAGNGTSATGLRDLDAGARHRWLVRRRCPHGLLGHDRQLGPISSTTGSASSRRC